MQKINCNKAKITENIVCYVLIFLAVILTPILAQPIAKLFDWVVLDWSREGQLRPFFIELFTAIFWLVEWIGYSHLKKFLAKKAQLNNAANETEAAVQEAAISNAVDKKQAKKAAKEAKKAKKATEVKPLLPILNVVVLFGLTAICIIVVTLQIGFKVKPFYELGDKTTYVKMLIKGGEIIRNLVKGMWIVCILKTSLTMAEEIVKGCKEKTMDWRENQVSLLKWCIVVVLTLAFGVFDVILFANAFALTYIVFYMAFVAIYFFANQAPIKSYLLICFIYIF